MLSKVLHLLKDSSKDETGVHWKWWDQHKRKAHWFQALTRQDVSIRRPVLKGHLFDHTTQSNLIHMNILFVLWIHCIDWEGYECMLSEMELGRVYGTWREWVGGDWLPFDVREQYLPSQGLH